MAKIIDVDAREGAIKLKEKAFKRMSIREFTQQIGATLLEGGEVVVYKGDNPYRYMNIRPIRLVSPHEGGMKKDEIEERHKEACDEGQEKLLEVDNA